MALNAVHKHVSLLMLRSGWIRLVQSRGGGHPNLHGYLSVSKAKQLIIHGELNDYPNLRTLHLNRGLSM